MSMNFTGVWLQLKLIIKRYFVPKYFGTSGAWWSLKVLYKILPGFKPSQKFPVGLCQAPPESQTGLSLY